MDEAYRPYFGAYQNGLLCLLVPEFRAFLVGFAAVTWGVAAMHLVVTRRPSHSLCCGQHFMMVAIGGWLLLHEAAFTIRGTR